MILLLSSFSKVLFLFSKLEKILDIFSSVSVFNVDILSVRSGDKKKLEKGSRFSIYCLVDGSLGICDQIIKAGDSFILPASKTNTPINFTSNSESKIIRITIPDQ